MKNRGLIFSFLFSVSFSSLLAQNKTLGVGTATPSPNAALHVESPTANQGFIMPRLTTLQRKAMAGILASSDKGLMLFDTDLNTIYIWDGAAWRTSAQVAGGPKLNYPYADTVLTPTGTVDLFAIRYGANENKRVVRIENNNPTNGSSTLSVANGGVGVTGVFNSLNPATTSSAVYATTASNAGGALAPVAVYGESTGTGSLGAAFWNQNAANTYPALYAKTLGTGSALFGETATGQNAIVGQQLGTTGRAGFFNVNNPANTTDALFAMNSGSGAGISSLNNGTGRSAYFEVNNAASTAPAVTVKTNVTGTRNGFESFHTGTGDAIFANANAGSAGNFQNTNPSSVYSTLFTSTNALGGHALGVNNTAQGNAISVFGGGLKISTAVVSTTTITTRAMAYRITTGGTTFTFSIPGYSFVDGDTFFVVNETLSSVTVEGLQLVSGEGKTFVYFGGVGFRAF